MSDKMRKELHGKGIELGEVLLFKGHQSQLCGDFVFIYSILLIVYSE